jgi:hypothetical protein
MSDEAVRQNIEIYDTLRFQLVNHILILVSFWRPSGRDNHRIKSRDTLHVEKKKMLSSYLGFDDAWVTQSSTKNTRQQKARRKKTRFHLILLMWCQHHPGFLILHQMLTFLFVETSNLIGYVSDRTHPQFMHLIHWRWNQLIHVQYYQYMRNACTHYRLITSKTVVAIHGLTTWIRIFDASNLEPHRLFRIKSAN